MLENVKVEEKIFVGHDFEYRDPGADCDRNTYCTAYCKNCGASFKVYAPTGDDEVEEEDEVEDEEECILKESPYIFAQITYIDDIWGLQRAKAFVDLDEEKVIIYNYFLLERVAVDPTDEMEALIIKKAEYISEDMFNYETSRQYM